MIKINNKLNIVRATVKKPIEYLYRYMLFVFVFIVITVKFYAVGGVDLEVYKRGVQNINFNELFYYKEFVSWSIIFVADNIINDPIRWWIVIDILLFSILLIESNINNAIYLMIFSMTLPMYYLMSMNVLRQWISVAFLLGMTIQILDRGKVNLMSIVYLTLAVLSHNMSVVCVVLFIAVTIMNKNSIKKNISLLIIMFAAIYGIENLESYFYIDINELISGYADQLINEVASPYKKFYYLLICFSPHLISGLSGVRAEPGWSVASLILLMLPFPDWIIERFMISCAFISLMTYAYQLLKRGDRRCLLTLNYCALISIFMTIAHSGVQVVLLGGVI